MMKIISEEADQHHFEADNPQLQVLPGNTLSTWKDILKTNFCERIKHLPGTMAAFHFYSGTAFAGSNST